MTLKKKDVIMKVFICGRNFDVFWSNMHESHNSGRPLPVQPKPQNSKLPPKKSEKEEKRNGEKTSENL